MLLKLQQVKVEDGTFNFTEPLEDWTSYIIHDNPDRPMLYHKVIDLEPDSHYELVVEARNSLGKSDPSARFIFLTAPGLFCFILFPVFDCLWLFDLTKNMSASCNLV